MLRSSNFAKCVASLTYTFTAVAIVASSSAQGAHVDTDDPKLFQDLRWHEVGPFRGGRVTAVTGIPGKPQTFLQGATGGGVWRTDNGGGTWRQLGVPTFRTGSVGALAVAPSNPKVIYVGMGESCYRLYASSFGDGIYRSDDAGESWRRLGLEETRQIGAILLDPHDPDRIFVAAQGSPWGASAARGVYASDDGGKTWRQSLFVSDTTGAFNVERDSGDARVLYASMWDHDYDPGFLRSGGTGSGVFKSSDAGATWARAEIGLPVGRMGKVGIAASPRVAGRIWALVESDAATAGLYRSDDSGASWKLLNSGGEIRTRPWYYAHLVADPNEPDTIYSLAQDAYVSHDGGRSFQEVKLAGYDFHDLWISPGDPQTMIVGSDGGATITQDQMRSWSSVMNQPTAQMYRVSVDTGFPYRIYSAQQDNTTVSISSRPDWGGFDSVHYIEVGGGETGYVEPDPLDPLVVYASNELGMVTRFDRRSSSKVQIHAHLAFSEGIAPSELRYRFSVNSPVVASRHSRCVLYHGSQYLLRSANCGNTWEQGSPDLTLAETSHQGGGPYTNEIINHYGALASISESPINKEVLWTGSNDGVVAVTRDGGKLWARSGPERFARGAANTVEASAHSAAAAYVAIFSMPWNDYRPHLYSTSDYGETWSEISKTLPASAGPARVIREDPQVRGLLYAGTETAVYFSPDAGTRWIGLSLNLPAVPVSDLKVAGDDLVISTQGRGLWLLPNIAPLRLYAKRSILDENALLVPKNVYAIETNYHRRLPDWADTGFNARFPSFNFGDTIATGAYIDYFLPARFDPKRDRVEVTITDERERVVRRYSSQSTEVTAALSPKAGHNRLVWDLKQDTLPEIPGVWDSRGIAPKASLGAYSVHISAAKLSRSASFNIISDPRFPGFEADLQKRDFVQAQVVSMLEEILEVGRGVERRRQTLQSPTDDELLARIQHWQQTNADPRLSINNDRVNFGASLIYDVTQFLDAVESATAPLTPTYDRRLLELQERWSGQRLLAEALVASPSPR